MADAVVVKKAEAAAEVPPFILGTSPILDGIRARIRTSARHSDPVLLLGEPGTGKDELARLYHKETGRDGAFVRVNCRALNPALGLSVLFGHEKGAFTGADALRPGVFELAAGGTVFLDEIGHLPPELHGALIHVLQQGCFARVGGQQQIFVDIRVVAATNVPLRQLLLQGKFPLDIYDRLSQVEIDVPPLRERGRDIAVILDHYWKQALKKYDRSLRLAHEARRLLLLHRWPGNIREMQKVITALVTNARCRRVTVEDVCGALRMEGDELPQSLDARLDAELSDAPHSAAELAECLRASPSSVSRRLRKRVSGGQATATLEGRRFIYAFSQDRPATDDPSDARKEPRTSLQHSQEERDVHDHSALREVIEKSVLALLGDGVPRAPGELLRAIGADTTTGRRMLYEMVGANKVSASGATRRRRYYLSDNVTSTPQFLSASETKILASLRAQGPMSPAQVAATTSLEPWRARRALYRLCGEGVSATGFTHKRRYFLPSPQVETPMRQPLTGPRAPP